MTEDELLDELIAREGGFVDHSADRGGPTKYGITAETLGNWLGLSGPAHVDVVRQLTEASAKAIYRARYIEQPGLTAETIPNEQLRVAVIDEGVISGPRRAIQNLQRQLGVTVDGVIGPHTCAALQVTRDEKAWRELIVNIVRDRALRMVRIVEADRTQLVFLRGWLSRALGLLT